MSLARIKGIKQIKAHEPGDKKDNPANFEFFLKHIQWDNVLQQPSSDIYFHNFVKTFFEIYHIAFAKVSIEIESKNLKSPCIRTRLKK